MTTADLTDTSNSQVVPSTKRNGGTQ